MLVVDPPVIVDVLRVIDMRSALVERLFDLGAVLNAPRPTDVDRGFAGAPVRAGRVEPA